MINLQEFFYFFITHIDTVWEQTLEHLLLTSVSIILSTVTGIITGILLTRFQKFSAPVLAFANIIQTIPSLALLGLLLPFLGIGVIPAIVALFLYGLLPIIRNTYAGIVEIDTGLIEVANGIGLTPGQVLTKIQLPIAIPVIFAGIRTAAVINIGIATLTALIGAGGLGEYIFRGISVNNSYMILSGAIPAALLALAVDFLLGILQRNIRKIKNIILFITAGLIFIVFSMLVFAGVEEDRLVAGFPSEFMEREDGYRGMVETYGLDLEVKEMEIGLMYDAIKNKEVDLISGFSTDGRIKAYNLVALFDDKGYFPPYHAAPLVRVEVLQKFPELVDVFMKMDDLITDSSMMEMNFQVDHNKEDISTTAKNFLSSKGFSVEKERNGTPDLIIGSKAFTESFILAEMFRLIVENYTTLDAETKLGFGGTKLIFDAMLAGQVDMYPEYTGTALLVLLNTPEAVQDSLENQKERVYAYVNEQLKKEHDLLFLAPLGFNNTYAISVRDKMAEKNNLQRISDLAAID